MGRPWTWLTVLLALTVLAGSHLPSLEVRTDGESLHPPDHPTMVRTREDRDRFREGEQVVLLATAETGSAPPWDGAAGMTRLATLQEALEGLPETDPHHVRSAATVLMPPDSPRTLALRRYLEVPPADGVAAAALARELRSHSLVEGLFLSADGRRAAFYLSLVPREGSGLSRTGQLASLERRLPDLAPPGVRLQLLGPAVAEARLGERVLDDLARLLPAMLLVMVGVLVLTLRSLTGVLVPLITAGVTLVWTFGTMAAAGIPVTLVTVIVPVVLLAMAVTDEIHLLERLQDALGRSPATRTGRGAAPPPPDREAVRRATLHALGRVGRPVVLTSLTTAAGFLSFLSATLPPVRWFGVFVAFGILAALLFTFTLVPALLAVLPPGWSRPRRSVPSAPLRPGPLERWAVRHPRRAAAVGGLFLVLLVPGIARIEVHDSWIGNFSSDSSLVRADRAMNRAFWGTYRLDVVLDHPQRRFFRRAEGLAVVERVREVARRSPHVTGVVTHLLPYEMLGRPWNLPTPLSRASEEDLQRVAAIGELVARSTDLRWFLTPEGDAARLQLVVGDADYERSRKLRNALERELPRLLEGTGVAFHLSGDLPLAVDVVDAVVGDQVRSIAWTLVAVMGLVALAVRRVVPVTAVLTPPLAAVAAVLGGMGWGGLPLGIATSTFAALTLGVGVDFGIHVEASFRHHRSAGREPAPAMARALAGTGRALRWNTMVLAAGFLVLTLSTLPPNRNLGLLLAAGLAASWLAAVLLLPALMTPSATSDRPLPSEGP